MSLDVTQDRRVSGLALVSAAYVIATLAGSAVLRALDGRDLVLVLALADVVATVVVFVFSRAFDNSSVYDPYWSVAPALLALAQGPSLSPRAVLVVGLVLVYAARLTWNWLRGWSGLGHEDWRYADLRAKTGKAYWVVSFLGLHLMPTVMVFLGCLPLFFALPASGGQGPLGPLDALAALVTAGAILIEGAADNQLRAFRAQHPSQDICEVGLWRYSRHPNYFGEISFWLGLALFGLAVGAPWWTWVGFVAMVALFLGASIPMAEKRSLARRPHYAEHQKRVSKLIPWFRAP